MGTSHKVSSSSRPGMIKRMGRGERRRRRKQRIRLAGIAAALGIITTTAGMLAWRELGLADRMTAERLQTLPALETLEVETLPLEQPAQPGEESTETATNAVKPDAISRRPQALETGQSDRLALPASLSDEADAWGSWNSPRIRHPTSGRRKSRRTNT